ncbi:YceK/YidQ family lipoprotein [Pseudomonas sp. RL_5y_Pfl2_73]
MVGKLLRMAVMPLLVVCMSGCGTYLARLENGEFSRGNEYYKGVNADIKVLGDDVGYLSMACYVTIICPFVFLASIPIDLAVDTILVPRDYLRATRRKNMTYREVSSGASYGSIKVDFGTSVEKSKKHSEANYKVSYRKQKHSLVLWVNDVVLAGSTLTAIIPYIEGYEPQSMHAYSGGGNYLQSVGVSIDRFRFSEFRKDSDNTVGPQPSGEILTCDEYGSSQSTVSITPYLSAGLQISLRIDNHGAPSLRC